MVHTRCLVFRADTFRREQCRRKTRRSRRVDAVRCFMGIVTSTSQYTPSHSLRKWYRGSPMITITTCRVGTFVGTNVHLDVVVVVVVVIVDVAPRAFSPLNSPFPSASSIYFSVLAVRANKASTGNGSLHTSLTLPLFPCSLCSLSTSHACIRTTYDNNYELRTVTTQPTHYDGDGDDTPRRLIMIDCSLARCWHHHQRMDGWMMVTNNKPTHSLFVVCCSFVRLFVCSFESVTHLEDAEFVGAYPR